MTLRSMGRLGPLAGLSLLAGTLAFGGEATGPAVGAKIPAFEVLDTAGRSRNFEDLRGRKGLLVLFYRSASW